MPYPTAKTTAQRNANDAFNKARKARVDGWNKQIKTWNGSIKTIEDENAYLSGNRTGVPTPANYAGEMKEINDQLGTPAAGNLLAQITGGATSASGGLYGLQAIVGGWHDQLGGVGGDIDLESLNMSVTKSAMDTLKPGADAAMAAAVASAAANAASSADSGGSSGDATGTTVDNSAMLALVQQQLATTGAALAVSQAQYKVLENLPPFGGSFAQGGVVPGPLGQARTIIAHGGEKVTSNDTTGDILVHNHFAPGMEWLADLMDTRVERRGRSQGRAAAYALPSRGGGLGR